MVRGEVDLPVFDRPHAVALAKAKKEFLDLLLPDLVKAYNLKTALDAGCGLGYFSGYLKELGLRVKAFDGRSKNVTEARRRYRDVEFLVYDIEDPSITSLGQFDLVLCLGLLYHLENPFRAVRNLAEITGRICIIETMTSPFKALLAVLVEEGEGLDQSLNYCALIPSESCLVKMLYKAGFPSVYKVSSLPDHPDFRSRLVTKQKRTILIATKLHVEHPMLSVVQGSKDSNRYIWSRFRWPFGFITSHDRPKRVARGVLQFWRVTIAKNRRGVSQC